MAEGYALLCASGERHLVPFAERASAEAYAAFLDDGAPGPVSGRPDPDGPAACGPHELTPVELPW